MLEKAEVGYRKEENLTWGLSQSQVGAQQALGEGGGLALDTLVFIFCFVLFLCCELPRVPLIEIKTKLI